MLEAKVFFFDGHTEDVISHTYDEYLMGKDQQKYIDECFKFRTESGLYMYTNCYKTIPLPYPDIFGFSRNYVVRKQPVFYKDCGFGNWILCVDQILKIEFYTKEYLKNNREMNENG